MHIAVVDIGKPGKTFGWALKKAPSARCEGNGDIDRCIEELAGALNAGPLALGFEAPMFVPIRQDPALLTAGRSGESGKGIPSRPFSAGAGAAVLVTALVVVPYILANLRERASKATATFDWRAPPSGAGRLLLFEAFVTDQRKTTHTRHVEDACLAIEVFQKGMQEPLTFNSAVVEPTSMNLLGAILLRTGWTTDLAVLSQSCLVVKA